jgi:hypothetical protein
MSTTIVSTPGAAAQKGDTVDADVLIAGAGAPAHPLLGGRLPRIDLRGGRGLLLTGGHRPDLALALAPWADRVDHAVSAEPLPDAVALLVHPDGYVCRVGRDDAEQPQGALRTWFGAR